MQSSEAPGQGVSAKLEDSPSHSTKRRRTSEHSPQAVATTEYPEPSNAPSSMDSRPVTTSSPQRGSSREAMTPPEGSHAIKYTRTGRVSKATKGQRVHHCDECGKTYTRAEHLRRHQQNHKPGAFPCDVPGCGRSFHREDLLIRHKVRHNDPLNPPSRHPSPESQGSAPVGEGSIQPISRGGFESLRATETESDLTEVPSAPALSNARQSSTQRTPKGYLDLNQLNHAQIPVPVNIDGAYPSHGLPWDPSPPYSPSGYDSPTNNDLNYSNGLPYYQPHPARARNYSSASYLSYYPPPNTSRSPVSAGSSTVYLPQWGPSAHDARFQHFSTPPSGSEGSYGAGGAVYDGGIPDHHLLPGPFGSSRAFTAVDRDYMEQDDLIVPTRTIPHCSFDISFDDNTYSNEERYLSSYWLSVHPFFPVVRKPNFSLPNASPLLKAAMLALGAYALGDAADKSNGRLLHERCLKVLKKRTLNGWHTFRICDMQAAFLVEVYSVFKARRQALQLSKIFEDIYHHLAQTMDAMYSNPAQMYSVGDETGGSLYDVHCWQRLLLACYVLDQQHAALFARRKSANYSGSGLELPFPRSQAWWDGNLRSDSCFQSQLVDESPVQPTWQVLEGLDANDSGSQALDTFQSLLIIACLSESSVDFETVPLPSNHAKDIAALLARLDPSPRIQLAAHVFALCRNTPVRDILAVAGESWVMSEKLRHQTDYTAAQIDGAQWARGLNVSCPPSTSPSLADGDETQVQKAVKHALRILELHRSHPVTGLPFQEWSVYLAAVVVWARAYVTSQEPRRKPRVSIPSPPERRPSMDALDHAVSNIVHGEPNGAISIHDARDVLLWTKAKIERVDVPHNCGLTNGALDVLGKLITRGNEEGWFGS